MNLISLVGEQPIPNLLVARALEMENILLCYSATTEIVAQNLARMLPGARLYPVEPYDLELASSRMDILCTPETVVNLTGGTKPMALAAYEIARRKELPIVYLQSEGAATVLYRYGFSNGSPTLIDRMVLGVLIDIDDYLLAHGLKAIIEKEPQNSQESGLKRWFEKQVDECRANLVFESFEIDFILRRGNRVAVMEAKTLGKSSRKRFGIDQLNTMAGRAYLGTYTGKILATDKLLGPQLKRLAEARGVQVVLVEGKPDPRTGRLIPDADSKDRLSITLDKILGPRFP